MFLKSFVTGPLGVNCYVVACDDTKQAAVIDPGGGSKKVLRLLKDRGLNLKYIINTHAHFDHTAANTRIKRATGAAVLIHEDDVPRLSSRVFTSLRRLGGGASRPVDRELRHGDQIDVGSIVLEVIHTPGHTPGGISLKGVGFVFTGDTLSARSVGRTDLSGGDTDTLIKSIKERLLKLDDETVIFPGHGASSTIGRERQGNPFLAFYGAWRKST